MRVIGFMLWWGLRVRRRSFGRGRHRDFVRFWFGSRGSSTLDPYIHTLFLLNMGLGSRLGLWLGARSSGQSALKDFSDFLGFLGFPHTVVTRYLHNLADGLFTQDLF